MLFFSLKVPISLCHSVGNFCVALCTALCHSVGNFCATSCVALCAALCHLVGNSDARSDAKVPYGMTKCGTRSGAKVPYGMTKCGTKDSYAMTKRLIDLIKSTLDCMSIGTFKKIFGSFQPFRGRRMGILTNIVILTTAEK
jgi:hypothetical protein